MRITVLGLVLLSIFLASSAAAAPDLTISRADYDDRVQAIWAGQIIAVILGWPFEHQTASDILRPLLVVERITFPACRRK